MSTILEKMVNDINSRLKEILNDNFDGWTITTREGYEVVGYTRNTYKLDRGVISVILSYAYESLEKTVKKYLKRSSTSFLAVDIFTEDSTYKIILLPHPLFFLIIVTNQEGLCRIIMRRKDIINSVSEVISRLFK